MAKPLVKKTLSFFEAATRVAKPFPSSYGLGHDICHTERLVAILRQENTRNRWARRVFTRLEWPVLISRFLRAGGIETDFVSKEGQRQPQDSEVADRSSRSGSNNAGAHLMLPKLPGLTALPKKSEQSGAAIADPLLSKLVRHLAGRWAAKEAVIKAHQHRRLYMQDISILQAAEGPIPAIGSGGPYVLVEPICDLVAMSESVAASRGLLGARTLQERALTSRVEIEHENQGSEGNDYEKKRTFTRRAKVNPADRQTAKISISHDGDLASAVCMAFDPPDSQREPKKILDEGRGPSIHEPQWGDQGWLGSNYFESRFIDDTTRSPGIAPKDESLAQVHIRKTVTARSR